MNDQHSRERAFSNLINAALHGSEEAISDLVKLWSTVKIYSDREIILGAFLRIRNSYSNNNSVRKILSPMNNSINEYERKIYKSRGQSNLINAANNFDNEAISDIVKLLQDKQWQLTPGDHSVATMLINAGESKKVSSYTRNQIASLKHVAVFAYVVKVVEYFWDPRDKHDYKHHQTKERLKTRYLTLREYLLDQYPK